MEAWNVVLFILIDGISIATGLEKCPQRDHPLILISMDGFRYNYLDRRWTPNIEAFRNQGVSVQYMKPSYPTITFPNHYTIVTGLYPESHGIVENHFYDPIFNESFDYNKESATQGKWWGGDPIWNTVVKQDKKSAAYFWPGSGADIEGMYPTYWFPYNTSTTNEERINQTLEWLSLPPVDRPICMCIYFSEPDHSGHKHGPDSKRVDVKLKKMDRVFQSLIDGIAAMKMTSCVNIILLADHGMANSDISKMIILNDIVPDITDKGYIFTGPLTRMSIFPNCTNQTDAIRASYACQSKALRQYSPDSLPTRLHYSNNLRIGDIVLHFNSGYYGALGKGYSLDGQHGYDYYYANMQPIFMAAGPDFKSGVEEEESFQNIELYNLMCHLVGVTPAPNNGSVGSLYRLLKNPPPYPETSTEEFPSASFPSEEDLPKRLNISGCRGDPAKVEDWIYELNMTEEEKNASEKINLPWGNPLASNMSADLLILYQKDHITGFSQTIKMPLWSSFTITSARTSSPAALWTSDVRLTEANTPTCPSYQNLKPNTTMQPLFPNRYSLATTSRHLPYMASNAVAMTWQLRDTWSSLIEVFLWSWFEDTKGPINAMVGPVFDRNADSLVDDFDTFTSLPVVPSDLFLIVTRCLYPVGHLSNCHPSKLDAIAFIYPENDEVPNCMTPSEYALMFSSRVKDVELATGLTFYPSLPFQDRNQLELRIHSTLWDLPPPN